MRSAGKTRSERTSLVLPSSSMAACLIQSSSKWASRESRRNRLPPSCGTIPDGLSKTRLRSGSIRLTRRPRASCVSDVRSNAGSSPRRLNRNPPLPFKLPWQAPMLQPALEKRGTTSLRRPGGRTHAARVTFSSTRAHRSPRLITIQPCPLALGRTAPFGPISAIAAGSMRNPQRRVTSRRAPSAARKVTASCCRARRPLSSTRAGSTSSAGPTGSPTATQPADRNTQRKRHVDTRGRAHPGAGMRGRNLAGGSEATRTPVRT